MAQISIDFDYLLKVIRPILTKPLANKDKTILITTGDFKFTSPKPVILESQAIAPTLSPIQYTKEDKATYYEAELDNLYNELDKYGKVIDKKCKHLLVYYFPEKKEHEYITESCSKIFGDSSGIITYDMYSKAVAQMQKLDKLLAHRAAENNGTL